MTRPDVEPAIRQQLELAIADCVKERRATVTRLRRVQERQLRLETALMAMGGGTVEDSEDEEPVKLGVNA